MKRIALAFILVTAGIATAAAQDAAEIVRRADDRQDYETAYMEARMVNTDQFGSKTIAYEAWAKGTSFLMEFTSDAEFGQRILRSEGRIYHFFPDTETVITRSQGDSIVGLISYDDVTNEDSLLDNYEARMDGEETVDGVEMWRIRLQARPRSRVAYANELVWIEKESLVIRRVEMYTRSMQPLKTMEMREVRDIDGVIVPVEILLTDEVRQNVTSEIFIEEVEVGISIPDSRFTRRALTR